jgi:hypothetical protein
MTEEERADRATDQDQPARRLPSQGRVLEDEERDVTMAIMPITVAIHLLLAPLRPTSGPERREDCDHGLGEEGDGRTTRPPA